MLIFHEGNIPEEHQQYINSKSPEVYNFIDVSEDFKYDKSIISEVPDIERFNIGYRLMCRFNFFHIWKYVNKYDFLIRIDEDVIVKKFSKSLLDNLNNNFIFGTADLSSESHEYTNISLPEELKKFLTQLILIFIITYSLIQIFIYQILSFGIIMTYKFFYVKYQIINYN